MNTIALISKLKFAKSDVSSQKNAAKIVTPASLIFSGIISIITVNVSDRIPNDPKKRAESSLISGIKSIIVSVSEWNMIICMTFTNKLTDAPTADTISKTWWKDKNQKKNWLLFESACVSFSSPFVQIDRPIALQCTCPKSEQFPKSVWLLSMRFLPDALHVQRLAV